MGKFFQDYVEVIIAMSFLAFGTAFLAAVVAASAYFSAAGRDVASRECSCSRSDNSGHLNRGVLRGQK